MFAHEMTAPKRRRRLTDVPGKHIPGVVDAFRNGGGVPYSEFRPEFTGFMDDMFRRDYNESLLDPLKAMY